MIGRLNHVAIVVPDFCGTLIELEQA